MPRNTYKELVHLHTFSGVVYAEMAKAMLEEQEIPTIVKRNFLTSAYGSAGTDFSPAALWVQRINFERAEAILADYLGSLDSSSPSSEES